MLFGYMCTTFGTTVLHLQKCLTARSHLCLYMVFAFTHLSMKSMRSEWWLLLLWQSHTCDKNYWKQQKAQKRFMHFSLQMLSILHNTCCYNLFLNVKTTLKKSLAIIHYTDHVEYHWVWVFMKQEDDNQTVPDLLFDDFCLHLWGICAFFLSCT